MAARDQFLTLVDEAVERFPQNRMCRLLDGGGIQMADYHAILLMLFHQTFEGPSTFALAGAHCPPSMHEARDYLLQHADEEKSHWQWVISDLRTTGWAGPDPRELFPRPACQAYVAFNVYVAVRAPLARLGIAMVLESIGARHGKAYATRLCKALQLAPDQARFFYGHGDTDVGHSRDLLEVIDRCGLGEREWAWMHHAARTAGALYQAMYDEALQVEVALLQP